MAVGKSEIYISSSSFSLRGLDDTAQCSERTAKHHLFFTVDAGLLARSQYSEGPATGHLDTGFSLFPCA